MMVHTCSGFDHNLLLVLLLFVVVRLMVEIRVEMMMNEEEERRRFGEADGLGVEREEKEVIDGEETERREEREGERKERWTKAQVLAWLTEARRGTTTSTS